MRDPATPILAFALFAFVAFVAFVVGLNVAWHSSPSLEQWMQSRDLVLREEDGTLAKDVEVSRTFYDADGDCQDTRAEVLIKHSLEPVTFKDTGKGDCVVESGVWIDPYSRIRYDNADDLAIDHRVPVGEAARSGGVAWGKEKWRDFYNDCDNLVPVWKYLNQSKGDRSPGMWEPARGKADYARKWIQTKRKWKLSLERKEAHEVRDLLSR